MSRRDTKRSVVFSARTAYPAIISLSPSSTRVRFFYCKSLSSFCFIFPVASALHGTVVFRRRRRRRCRYSYTLFRKQPQVRTSESITFKTRPPPGVGLTSVVVVVVGTLANDAPARPIRTRFPVVVVAAAAAPFPFIVFDGWRERPDGRVFRYVFLGHNYASLCWSTTRRFPRGVRFVSERFWVFCQN